MRTKEIDAATETARAFQEKGYAPIDMFSAEEADEYRDQIVNLRDHDHVAARKGAKWNFAHGVSYTPALWSLITHPRILDAVRDVLGTCGVIYAEHSALKVWRGPCPASGWHRDSIVERPTAGGEWSTDHRVVCYFQDAVHGFMWGAIDGSHRAERELSQWERALWRQVQDAPQVEIGSRLSHLSASPTGRPWIRTGNRLRRWHAPAAPTWIETKPTQCILFDPRLIHAGGPVRDTKIAAFLAFGANDVHTQRHRQHFGCGRNPYRLALSGYLNDNGLI